MWIREMQVEDVDCKSTSRFNEFEAFASLSTICHFKTLLRKVNVTPSFSVLPQFLQIVTDKNPYCFSLAHIFNIKNHI